jgi:polyisoprenoid-binding protein YceI
VITVNARTLVTDQDRRNQAIRNRILLTDQFEFVTFTPTGVSGLSGSAGPGQSFNFQISGDLTIREITRPVVFDTTVTVESMERVRGLASTTILRSDYDILIPSVPFVANVGENIGLEIEFTLVPAA